MRDRDEATALHDALPVGYHLHHYRIEAVLGASHFGIVYKAMYEVLHNHVAIKEYFPGVIDPEGNEPLPVADLVKSKIIQEYGEARNPLNIVAITDGAKDIRGRLLAIFGVTVVIVLDGFHLGKKVQELMSMIAPTKAEKRRI